MSMRQLQDPQDDDWIEDEIQRQLDELELPGNLNDDNDIEEEEDLDEDEEEEEKDDYDEIPDSVTAYLERVQSRSEGVMKEIDDCTAILKKVEDKCKFVDARDQPVSKAIEEIAFTIGEDPELLYDRVMEEIEKEEEKDEMDENGNGEIEDAQETFLTVDDTNETPSQLKGATALVNGEVTDKKMWTVAVVTESAMMEREAREKLKELMQKQREKDERRQMEYELQKDEMEKQDQRISRIRREKFQEYDNEQKEMKQKLLEEENKIEKEFEEDTKRMEVMLSEYKANIDELDQKTHKEKEELEIQLQKQRKETNDKIIRAAVKIQATYRSYRVRKPYINKLKKRREERKTKVEMERQVEILENRRKEEQKRKKELAIKKKKEEDEKRKKEEEEQRKLEEERRKREEKEKERIKEEERKQKEEEERRRKVEEERKRQEAEKEMKEKEEQKKREEEERIQQENERLRKEVEAKHLAEIEKKRMEDEKMKIQEQKSKEEERKKNAKDDKEEKERRLREQLEKEQHMNSKKKDDIELKAEKILGKIQDQIGSTDAKLMEAGTVNRKSASVHQNILETRSDTEDLGARNKPNNDKKEKDKTFVLSRTSKEVDSLTNNVELEENSASNVTMFDMLPQHLESQRLQWMENCIPWSKVISESKSKSRRHVPVRGGKRPMSAKNLPELSEDEILQASSPHTHLQDVITVQVHGLNGCNMCSLQHCPLVRSISLVQCGIVSTDGMNSCKELQHLNLQHNKVECLNCQDLQKLQEVQMSNNCLSSIHGLDGCLDLRVADFSNNRITRIGGLDSCSKLTRLLLDHNQLISTRGMNCTPSVHILDLSHNHLNNVQELEKCCLLKTLNLTGNNLQEPPLLKNHVLLRQLFLDDNSLSSLENLSKAWLPLLEHLSVSQNSLTTIPSLSNCLLLKRLDISHNCIDDVASVTSGISECYRLQDLVVQGNPVTEETKYRSVIVSQLPWLQRLDSEDLNPKSSADQFRLLSSFEAMCHSQVKLQDNLQTKHRKQIQEARQRHQGNMNRILDLKSQHFNEVYELAVQHRYTHEYGELAVDSTMADSSEELYTSTTKNKPDKQVTFTVTADMVGKKMEHDGEEQFHVAATKIQAAWRGYCVRSEIDIHMQKWFAATVIQSYWRGCQVRKQLAHHHIIRNQDAAPVSSYPSNREQTITHINVQNAMANQLNESPLEYMAATTIQAWWRGCYIRRRISEFRGTVRFDEDDDVLFGEVDLSSFEFNEENFDQGWVPPETPRLPMNHPVLPPTPPVQPHPPRNAWRGANSPLVDNRGGRITPMGRPPLPPGSSLSGDTGFSPRTHASSKQDKLSEEWGFKDSSTAELMLKRAKKMQRKKKIIDPQKKYELFKKLQETNKNVHPPVRKQAGRKDYFKAKQQIQTFIETENRQEKQHKKDMVFEWVHTQAGPYSSDGSTSSLRPHSGNANTTNPATNNLTAFGRYASEPSLPCIDPQVLESGRVQLVSSPSIELQSVGGDTSTVVSSQDNSRRHSFSSPIDERVQFPPLKTNSAPTSHTRARMAVTGHDAWGAGRRKNKHK
ncbi:leucine-rich repeat- and IQ domain-containing protein 1-like [Saccoglossus kowalevskii]|uniref:Leucine-rich repeat and IQ domain-containing protein 1-like n=1 Tax=Saccoglossus kowalevskii TaxID=10224 RepID=A0ABM0MXL9_SACKO|nr:PREDICTED: leucine-rich repeat and IQ domain-containing protein 1-like [Saccoglossus kowalevskii]